MVGHFVFFSLELSKACLISKENQLTKILLNSRLKNLTFVSNLISAELMSSSYSVANFESLKAWPKGYKSDTNSALTWLKSKTAKQSLAKTAILFLQNASPRRRSSASGDDDNTFGKVVLSLFLSLEL